MLITQIFEFQRAFVLLVREIEELRRNQGVILNRLASVRELISKIKPRLIAVLRSRPELRNSAAYPSPIQPRPLSFRQHRFRLEISVDGLPDLCYKGRTMDFRVVVRALGMDESYSSTPAVAPAPFAWSAFTPDPFTPVMIVDDALAPNNPATRDQFFRELWLTFGLLDSTSRPEVPSMQPWTAELKVSDTERKDVCLASIFKGRLPPVTLEMDPDEPSQLFAPVSAAFKSVTRTRTGSLFVSAALKTPDPVVNYVLTECKKKRVTVVAPPSNRSRQTAASGQEAGAFPQI
eukprot:c21354_g1_i1.p1 GENE.c21354_g1_i1~~c21354_g1_i1.p1  ORF type:complete len:313 (+),score=32.44 c21354_g1_i1:67-939(+)